jgi:hypothetical protein
MSAKPEQDLLFLAAPDFVTDGDGPFYCGDCIAIEGLLSLYPVLHEKLEVRRVPFDRPRQAVVELLSEANQSLPVLLLAAASEFEGIEFRTHNGIRFIDSETDIRSYLSLLGGVARQR